ncbi:hypothetical protein [Labrys monachus]|uniref:Rap1a immunity protein domain-containing protein n=1 Tax=Labrys monachus TaxID=217067 RepID=A0ABU0FLD5_9HYPH|nr:hypothetical protein [Labrys monachus]MDQ0395177.1 hypothetical protein [Labrys monachus]
MKFILVAVTAIFLPNAVLAADDQPATVANMRDLCETQRPDALFDDCGRFLNQMMDGLIELKQEGKPVICLPEGRPSTENLKALFMRFAEGSNGKLDNMSAMTMLASAIDIQNGCPMP